MIKATLEYMLPNLAKQILAHAPAGTEITVNGKPGFEIEVRVPDTRQQEIDL